jgi:hypothetical protein
MRIDTCVCAQRDAATASAFPSLRCGHELSRIGVRARLPLRSILLAPTRNVLTQTTNRLAATTDRLTLSIAVVPACKISLTVGIARDARRMARLTVSTARHTAHKNGLT